MTVHITNLQQTSTLTRFTSVAQKLNVWQAVTAGKTATKKR
uniref:DNA gyrase subunit B n=1 Tax=Ascaris lumbricoides TaxID=6252 RepID=A0A0M3IK85_ASCLU